MEHARQLRDLDLAQRLWVGDAVLTGGDDPVSTLIQAGSRSPYSHVGVMIGPGLVIEAYDYALTPDESDEGVFLITLDEFLDRCSRLRAVEVRRPLRIDRKRLVAAALHLEGHSPGFPTLGMACLGLCGVSDAALRVLPSEARRRVTTTLAQLAADGIWAVHCAETATRLYHEAGVPLRFRSPRLWPHLRALQHRELATASASPPGGRARTGPPLVDLPTSRRRAVEGRWPQGLRAAPYAVASTIQAVGYRARQGWRNEAFGPEFEGRPVTGRQLHPRVDPGRESGRESGGVSGDVADLILPGDFARADPFRLVGRYRRSADRWVEVTPPPRRSSPWAPVGVGVSADGTVQVPSEQSRPAVARRM